MVGRMAPGGRLLNDSPCLRYTRGMEGTIRAAVLGLVLAPALAAAQPAPPPVAVTAPDGGLLEWSSLVRRHGPLAVMVWSSWAPRARAVLASCEELAGAARRRGLAFLIVDVQEPEQVARRALAGSGLPWVHDRHGRLLRRYRVFDIPALLVVDREGTVVARLEPEPGALEAWK